MSDFIVAVASLILMLMTPKYIRKFLDFLIPAGGKSGSMFGSGMWEGLGMAIGARAVGGVMSVGKAAVGHGIAATGGGIGEVLKGLKKPGGLAGGIGGSDTKGPPPPPPPGGGAVMADATQLMSGQKQLTSGGVLAPMEDMALAEAMGGLGGGSTHNEGFAGGFWDLPPLEDDTAATGASGTWGSAGANFFYGPKVGGAFTRMAPSAAGRLEAFGLGFAQSLKQNMLNSIVTGRGVGIKTGLGMAVKDMDRGLDARAANRLATESYLPTEKLLGEANSGDSRALQDLQEIGNHQTLLNYGVSQIEAGSLEEEEGKAELESAQYELDATKLEYATAVQEQSDTSQLEMKKSVVEQRVKDAFRKIEGGKQVRRDAEQLVIRHQNAIMRINFENDLDTHNTTRMIEAAQARLGQKRLSDL